MADAEHTKNTAPAATSNRRSTTAFARRALVVLAVVLLALLAVEAGSACLPDLAAISVADAALEATPNTRFEGCGDGIIATLDDGGDAGESCDPGTGAGPDAGVPGCTADCRIECDGGIVDPKSNHCYFFAGIDTTIMLATNRCLTAGGHVVTLGTSAEADLVARLASPKAPTYWVGLSRLPLVGAYASSAPLAAEPGFPIPTEAGTGPGTGPCAGCFGIGDDAGIFPPEIGSGTSGGTDCIASANGGWVQVPCNASGTTAVERTTICEREPIGARAQDCIGGFCFTLGSTAGTKRYLVAVSATDPDTAAQSCVALGGSLVVFDTRDEREQLAHEIRVRYPMEVDQQLWIGLVEDGGGWRWEDGMSTDAAPRPLPWGNAQPPAAPAAGARAYMHLATNAYDTQLAYADDGGKTPRLYICQRPATD